MTTVTSPPKKEDPNFYSLAEDISSSLEVDDFHKFGTNLLPGKGSKVIAIKNDATLNMFAKCKKLFDLWINSTSNPEWTQVIEALKKSGLNGVAKTVIDASSTEGETKVGEKRKTTSQNETDAKKPKEDNASVDKEPSFSLESLNEKYQKAISVGYTPLHHDKLSAQQKEILDEVQAMLVVVNDSEFMATMSYLKPLVDHNCQSILEIHHVITLGHDKNSLVFYIGMFGKCPVAVTRVNQGCGRDALNHSGCFKNISLIAAVGVAAGFPENDVNLGDVIVSQQITDCSIYKEKNGERIPRGNTTPAFKYLVDRLKNSKLQWEFECALQGAKSSVKFGLFLSKPVLLDDEEEREKMLKYFGKEAKGYEMEGFSIAGGAIDCIIVKGVCDFASGKNKIWQPTAALAAIDCLHHDLSRMDLSLMKDVIQKGRQAGQAGQKQQANSGTAASTSQPNFDFKSALAKITENYVKLSKLPVNSILQELREKKVISPNEKEIIQETITLQNRRMEYLLDKIIIPSLEVGVDIKFKAFVEVMKNNDNEMFKAMAITLDLCAED